MLGETEKNSDIFGRATLTLMSKALRNIPEPTTKSWIH